MIVRTLSHSSVASRLFGGLFLVLLAAPLAAQERGLAPEDYYRMTFVGDVAVSPMGNHVAFTVTTVDEEENTRRRAVWLQHLRDGEPEGYPFRVTDPTRNASSPRWAPDGSLLSFSSRRGEDPNPIWFLRMDGIAGEGFRIEGVKGTPIWSPDGEWIAFTKRPEPEEEAGPREGWIAPDAISHTADPSRFDGRVITHLQYKRDGTHALLPHPAVNPKQQIYIVPSAGGEARRVTDVPFDVGGVTWTPDSSHLLFTGDEMEDDELNFEPTGAIYTVARGGGEARRITPGPGSARAPAVSPDGSRLAFLHTAERGGPTDLMVADLASDLSLASEPANLTKDWELGPGSPSWTPEGDALRWETSAHGNRHIYRMADAGGEIVRVTQGDRQLSSVSRSDDGRVMAYTSTDPVSPAEVYVSDGQGRGERQVTSFNEEWMAEVVLNPAERITWEVGDGIQIEGWVIPPVGHDPDGRYPMILKAHGGPAGMYGNTFFQTFHVLSAAGAFVFYPNPRGSSGYGHEFQTRWTLDQWGLVDEEDFLSGVDRVLERYPSIAPERLGVAGGSYGGYVTNWLTSRSDRFAAAVTSRSIASLETLYGTTDATGWDFGGALWDNREQFRRASPISHVENVTAATLIIHSEYDHRTPMQDAEMWFSSLKRLEVPVEFVRYPRSSHGLSRSGEPWLLVDRLERIRSWFVHWLIDEQVSVDGGGGG